MQAEYPAWLKNLEGNRPPLSIDIVGEFLLPILQRDRAAVFIVVDCLRLDQWRVLEPLLAPFFDVETTHYFAVLPTATPYSRNALFSGLFPGEIAARLPDWWGNAEREDESLNAHERELLEAHLKELNGPTPGSLPEDLHRRELRRARAAPWHGDRPRRRERVRVQLRRPAHARTQRIADPVRSRARRDRAAADHAAVVPALGAVQRAEGSVAAKDLGAPHDRSRLDPLQHAGDGLRQARRDVRTCATSSAKICAPSVRSRRCCSRTRTICACRGAALGANTLLATERLFLRLSDEAARVPEPLSRIVPPRRSDARGVILPLALLTPRR